MAEQLHIDLTNGIANPTFQVNIDENRIAIVTINTIDTLTNWLSENFITELRNIISTILYQQARGVIFISTKPHCFIRGFNLDILSNKTDDQLRTLSQEAQALMQEIATLKIPVVAAINGDCYGLGLELILACDYRLASNEQQTQFAMPQVRSGILPFAGGTQRLPRLIGLKDSVSLLLSGHKMSAEKALKLGLINQLVPHCLLFETAYRLILDNKIPKIAPDKQFSLIKKWQNKLENNTFLRLQLLSNAENKIWLKSFGNYPATTQIIEVLKEADFNIGLKREQDTLVLLYRTEPAQVLIALKNTMRKMKHQYRDRSQVRDITQVSILGSGFMGANIAYVTANNAHIPVRIKDIHPTEIQKALHTCYALMQKEVDKKRLKPGEMLQKMNLISGGERLQGAQATDFIIEAVYENLALKQQMLKESEAYYNQHAIFATNTSTLSIENIASVAKRPENVIGLHYFSPVSKRKMVEIIPHSRTSEHTIATAIHFAIQQDKIPLIVANKPGFFINRILTPYLLEALHCLIDGEAVEIIDRSLQEFGFKIGPLAMIDDIGLDVLTKSIPSLKNELGDRFELPEKIENLILNDRKGRKNRRGFYLYDSNSQRTMVDKSIYHVLETIARNDLEAEEIARRCILRMINEAVWCLQDQVIDSTDEGNVASVFGVSFPEFRGGIYAYIEKIGADEIVQQLRKHAQRYGSRFTPCDKLIIQANSHSGKN